jgi:parallel beta-helix repeat protein
LDNGVLCLSSTTTIKNNWIHDNASGIKLARNNDTSEIENNTVVNNTDYGIEKGRGNPSPTISNCILWGNGDDLFEDFSASYSWFTSDGNPLFVDVDGEDNILGNDDDDYHLTSDSPCINAGEPDYLPDAGEKDIDGGWRVMGGRIDMGAYENESACFPSDHDDYNKWVEVGKPACWCYQYQCNGDTDNLYTGKNVHGKHRYVALPDLSTFLAGWQKVDTEPGFEEWICADFDHDYIESDQIKRRISLEDLYIFSTAWRKFVTDAQFEDNPCFDW